MGTLANMFSAGILTFGLSASDAVAQERVDNESRIEHRLENPLPENTEPAFVTLTPRAGLYVGVEGIELNHEEFGYAVGEEFDAHIGFGSFQLDDSKLSLGLGLSTSFMAIVTGGVYDGFVAQQNVDFSAMFLDGDVSGGFYAGTGITFVSTLDPWKNMRTGVYGNIHAGGRLVFYGYGVLEIEVGGIFNSEDAGFFTTAGIGVVLPEVKSYSPE